MVVLPLNRVYNCSCCSIIVVHRHPVKNLSTLILMIVPPSKHHLAFRALIKQTGADTVVFFVSLDCDAVCCCYILAHLLRLEHVKFLIIPTPGYQSLRRQFLQLLSGELKISTVIFINNGGAIDLVNFLFEEEEATPDATFYVFDSHRPFDLSNVSDENQTVLLFSDQKSADDEYPEESNLLSGEEETEDETERKIKNYYRGTYYGYSIALSAYHIARKLARNSNDLLWSAIVGVTDQLVFERIRRDEYVMLVQELQKEVLTFNVPNALTKAVSIGDDQEEGESLDLKSSAVDEGHIEFSNEVRLLMYRHWSIYESLCCSKYIVSTLETWKDSGKKRLLDFVVKLSIPIHECKRPFVSISKRDQLKLSSKVKSLSKQFGLENMFYASFLRKQGTKNMISAEEVVHSVTTFLSQDFGEDESFLANFWKAYDCLNIKNFSVTMQGITQAKHAWKTIIRQGTQVIEKRAFSSSGPFRHVIIDEAVDQTIFASPSHLLELALFLSSAFVCIYSEHPRQRGKKLDLVSRKRNHKARNKKLSKIPLVVFLLNKARGTYSVVGLPGRNAGEFSKNTFGNAFREAAEKTEARYRQEGFDSNFIEIQKEDNAKFLEYLHSGFVTI